MSKNILFLSSNNGREFTSKNYNKLCEDYGIQCQFTNPYNQTQNGVSKQKNQILVESSCNMLQTTNVIILTMLKLYTSHATFKIVYIFKH